MSKKDDRIYVGHMADMIAEALNISKGKSKGEFTSDKTLQLALTHLIQIIGEAASKISVEFKEKNAQIPWMTIISMRHRVVHDYLNVDIEIVWDTVQNDLPELAQWLQAI